MSPSDDGFVGYIRGALTEPHSSWVTRASSERVYRREYKRCVSFWLRLWRLPHTTARSITRRGFSLGQAAAALTKRGVARKEGKPGTLATCRKAIFSRGLRGRCPATNVPVVAAALQPPLHSGPPHGVQGSEGVEVCDPRPPPVVGGEAGGRMTVLWACLSCYKSRGSSVFVLS
ncbi:hypothetical protein EDB81DRAFT_112589 [Dactylonectria macrodidyma]|uniref:Uncharacterized protein n=1 Tax=Dactylonectria macrodidyma TaxID=307937 RepID=A0A9P9E9Y0_9HYPO|nr:hypothetical protein EDB81DRAFT_112589 [Dactylonectria macrodidyma]